MNDESVNTEVESLVNIQDEPTPTEDLVESPVEQPKAEAATKEEAKQDSGYLDFNVVPEEHREQFKMRINADYRKTKTLEKREREAREKLREYEEKLAEASKPRQVEPPTQDDWYADPDAAQAKMQAAIESKANAATWDLEQQQRQQQHQAEIEKEKVKSFEDFASRAEKIGMAPQRLATAAMILDKALPANHQQFLLEHDYGPQLLNALASDPVELADLANLNPYQVGVKLDQMSQTFRKKTKTKAPPPEEPIGGSSVSTEEYGGLLKGSSFS